MATRKIAVIVGSLRKESFNRKVCKTLMLLAPPTLELEFVEIGQLSLFNQDEEANPPANYVEFRNKIKEFDGVLFATPEYNRSVPGCLKNALDVGSRPYGASVWNGKPAAVISVTPGAVGGFGANHHLRQALTFLNVPTLQQPEAYIGGAGDMFDAAGGFAKPATAEFMGKFLAAFLSWIEHNKAA